MPVRKMSGAGERKERTDDDGEASSRLRQEKVHIKCSLAMTLRNLCTRMTIPDHVSMNFEYRDHNMTCGCEFGRFPCILR
jgi:hypothetical protein